jgi:hypothetical protein
LLLVLLLASGWLTIRSLGERIDRLEARLAQSSGPEDRASTSDAIAALRAEIERQSARLISLEAAGPPTSADPADAARLREEWERELDAMREEFAALRDGSPVRGDFADAAGTLPISPLRFSDLLLNGRVRQGSNPTAPSWAAEQALGPPDTEGLGDFPTAWASQQPDGGIEWLEVSFPQAVAADGIVIVESYNPGAVVKVEVAGPGEDWRTVWSGRDPSTEEANELYVALGDRREVDAVRVTLDTRVVPGWNEIDAVGLEVGGETVWGSESEASSVFGAQVPIIRLRE